MNINTGTELDAMPVVQDLAAFDATSGNRLERLIFNHRRAVACFCVLATLVFGTLLATRLVLNASFEKMIPQHHPFIENYFANQQDLRGLGNAIRVVVENPAGDIYDPAYLRRLQQINDELTLTPGVDRAGVKSLWTPAVRWLEVTEEGFEGGSVMPDNYSGAPQDLEQVKRNIARSSAAQALIAVDQKSSMIFVPLLDLDAQTGRRLDYHLFSQRLEAIRSRFEGPAADKGQPPAAPVRMHIIGFAKLVGELIDGLVQVATYFGVAALIATAVIFFYTRCWRSTALVIACSLMAVLWQLGIVSALGFELDPFSMLVPFLIFAIGVSHGAQKMNGIMQDVGRGTHRLVAARYTFRRLFLAGLTALVADAVGFAVLMTIDIPVIRELALAASIGVAVLIFTNLVLLPVLLSYTGVSAVAASRSLQAERAESAGRGLSSLWNLLDRFTERSWATALILGAVVLAVGGFIVSLNLQIGDLDPGAPELRPDARYNQDNAFVTRNFALSSDQFAVIVKTPPDTCLSYEALVEVDRLAWQLRQVPGVQTTVSLADSVKAVTAGTYEGSFKWITLARNQETVNFAGNQAMASNPDLTNKACSVQPLVAYLTDHKAETLERVVHAVEAFATAHNTPERQFLLAAGSAGIEAATNSVVKEANRTMLLLVYGAVVVLCFITFRSWRAVVVAVLPLVLTSILCEALMVALGIGVKVATLPVIALGVGIGIDYALYLLSVQLTFQRQGLPLREAYKQSVQFTGRVVFLVGCTLGASVVTWAWSPIKFQADMGILLTFMFVLNMLGALLLVPALSCFLLNPRRAAAVELGHPLASPS